MAVTNQLLIYAAETSNKMDDASYSAALQRLNGVQADQVISSSLHNTVMRSSTLILKALIDSLITNSTLSEGSISTNSSEADVKALFDNLFFGFKADKDSNGDVLNQTYAVDINKDVNDATGVITLYLLSKVASGSPASRRIGEGVQIDTVAKAKSLEAMMTSVNADYRVLFRETSAASGSASKAYYGQSNNMLFNPSTGLFKVKQVSTPNLRGNSVICSTAAGTEAKIVNLTDFVLSTGCTIEVKFTYGNTATMVSLNVNSTGAKTVRYGAENYTALKANVWYTFFYDGTNWQILNPSVVDTATNATNAEKTSFTNNQYIERSVNSSGYFSMYDDSILHVFYSNAQLTGRPTKLINFGVMNSMRVQGSYSGYYAMQASAIDEDGTIYVISDRSASGYTLSKKAVGETQFTPVSGGYIYFKVLE